MVQEQHYGVWGEELEGIGINGDWNFLFQGKEYVDFEGFNVYDFHTRSYDPWTGRFLQIDGANQFASGYTGMGNNPVSFVDPDGQFAFAPILIGAAISAMSYAASVDMTPGKFSQNWNWGQFAKSVGIGAASGLVSSGIGSMASGMSGLGKFAFQTAAHGTWGGINSSLNGGNFWSGAASGAVGNIIGGATAGMGPGIQIGVSALMSGVASDFTGGSFWRGFAIGGIVAGANHLMHDPPGSFRKRMEAANKELLANAPKLEPITDALGIADYYLNGRSVGNIVYDLNGNPVRTDFSSYGSPDLIGGPLAKGDKAIKLGRILLNPKLWHNHKKAFLTMVGYKNFAKAVGGNPDISFKGTKIILTGTGQGFIREKLRNKLFNS